jgi:hypothetical protein
MPSNTQVLDHLHRSPGPRVPEGISRIIRTPSAGVHKSQPRLQQISINFDSAIPLSAVSELDHTTGWAEFEAAIRQDT